jgi:NADH pyrophosphatase NudC (nudix superfamily)
MTEEIAVDTEELVEARWFDRGKIRGVVARANSATRTP